MIKAIITVMISMWVSACGVMASTEADHINQLIEKRQYLSAYEALQKDDPKNKIPENVSKKVDLALHHSIHNFNHQLFAFVNLKPGEKKSVIKEEQQLAKTFSLKVNKIADRLLEKYPDHGELHRIKADYFFVVHMHYGYSWGGIKNILKEAAESAVHAEVAGLVSPYSALAMGLYALSKGDFPKGKSYIEKANSLDSNDKFIRHYVAEIYAAEDKIDEAITKAEKAKAELKDVPREYTKVNRLLGSLYEKKGDHKKAKKHYETSFEGDSANIDTLLGLIRVNLHHRNTDRANALSQNLMKKHPKKSKVHKGITKAYSHHKKNYLIPPIYRQSITALGRYPDGQSALRVFFAQYLFAHTDQHDEGVQALKQAKKTLEIHFTQDHPLNSLIENLLLRYDKESDEQAD